MYRVRGGLGLYCIAVMVIFERAFNPNPQPKKSRTYFLIDSTVLSIELSQFRYSLCSLLRE
jgi:hypothetical protein